MIIEFYSETNMFEPPRLKKTRVSSVECENTSKI